MVARPDDKPEDDEVAVVGPDPDTVPSLLAVELIAGVRGIQLRAPLQPSAAGRAALAAVAPFAGPPGPDIFMAPVIEHARAVIGGLVLRAEIEAAIGPLA